MIPYCIVRVGFRPGERQLMAGDMALLDRLLPKVTVLRRFRLGRTIRMSRDEAQELLDGLRGLDLSRIGSERYTRSATGGVTGTVRGLIEPFVEFLADGLESQSPN